MEIKSDKNLSQIIDDYLILESVLKFIKRKHDCYIDYGNKEIVINFNNRQFALHLHEYK